MELNLWRHVFSDTTTIGELYLDGEFLCYTLEDTARNHKEAKVTAIPAGRYRIEMVFAPHFNRVLPHLLDVPAYTGILIHNGCVAANTDGCILVGRTRTQDFIGESVLALDELLPKIEALVKDGPLFININGGYGYEDWTRSNPAV